MADHPHAKKASSSSLRDKLRKTLRIDKSEKQLSALLAKLKKKRTKAGLRSGR